jgi:glycerophosphoryl diester phosphodiesterase
VQLEREAMTAIGYCLLSTFVLSTLLGGLSSAQEPTNTPTARRLNRVLIDFGDRENIDKHRPIIIAHRGGVVSASSPECSLTAIQIAANEGYDMVELDVQVARDGVPMVFHDPSLMKACGKDGSVSDFSVRELESISYLVGNDRIVRLDTALKLCRRLGLGVMLDLKAGQNSRGFLESIDRLISTNDLSDAAISISGSSSARRFLQHVRFTPTDEEMRRLRAGETLGLDHRFWFGLPRQLQPTDISRLKAAGALIIPAINAFRYPADEHFELAAEDVKRLTEKGVDGFQIDSIYFPLFDNGESILKLRKASP